MPVAEPVPPRGNMTAVDDNSANLKLLEDILRKKTHIVRSFPLGRPAHAAAKQERPDLILLDVNRPEMDGYEVYERLKLSPCPGVVPATFISALNATAAHVAGKE